MDEALGRSSPSPLPSRSSVAAEVDALRAGDDAMFVELVQRYQRPLLQLARMYVSTESVAEELVQEMWIAVIKGIDRFERRSSLRTWIFRIMANQAKTRGARERRTVSLSDLDAGSDEPAVDPSRFRPAGDHRLAGHWLDAPADWGSNVEARLIEGETQSVIVGAIQALPAGQRLVMTLRDVEGWPSDEVCAALEISQGNQRVLLHRARAKVRVSVERYFAEAAGV
jgi:RNA polymerase sigma-70 factor (ECF subfamily)